MSLFNRARQTFSSKASQVDVDPHTWRLPSSYVSSKPDGKQTIIPNPKIFANAFIPSGTKSDSQSTVLSYPDISHAAVHLALLECFWNLRLSADKLDVEVNSPPAYEEKPRTEATMPVRLPESQKWDLLINLAVTRFAAWWSNINDVLRHASAYTHHAGDKVAVQLGKDHLPPLDVLLVWYSFMLNNDAYLTLCHEYAERIPRIKQLCFPWPAVRDVINMETMQFELPRTAQMLFSTLSGQSADIMLYLLEPPAYTGHSASPFEIDLAAEAKKHEKFMEDAHAMLWIRSPALRGSLERASVEYLNVQLQGAAYKGSEGDTTFGVELVWRTHMLFPEKYAEFLQELGGEGQESDSKDAKTCAFLLGSEDQPIPPEHCACWTCERIRDDLPTFLHRVSPTSPASLNPASSSASTTDPLSSLTSAQLRQIQDDLGFYTAVESARSRGIKLPTRPPTAAEKEAERIAKEKQKEVGYLPGLYEYTEILPDGRRKIRKQKYTAPYGTGYYV